MIFNAFGNQLFLIPMVTLCPNRHNLVYMPIKRKEIYFTTKYVTLAARPAAGQIAKQATCIDQNEHRFD